MDIMIKPIKEWKYIFLDTNIIIDLITNPSVHNKNIPVKNRIENTHKLFSYLRNSTNQKSTDYIFYISAITISELTINIEDENLFQYISNLLNSNNVTFVDYTKNIAHNINRKIKDYLPSKDRKSFINELSKKVDESPFNKRNWIIDDLKIASSAKFLKKLDVVISNDIKTFKPICEVLELPFITPVNLPQDLFGDIDLITPIYQTKMTILK